MESKAAAKMRDRWKGRKLSCVLTVARQTNGDFRVELPRQKGNGSAVEIVVRGGGEWHQDSAFSIHAMVAVAKKLVAVADLPGSMTQGVTVLGGSGAEWLVREAPGFVLKDIDDWTMNGLPSEGYARKRQDGIAVLLRDMVWPALILFTPGNVLTVLALGMDQNQLNPNHPWTMGRKGSIAFLPAAIEWQGVIDLDYDALRGRGCSAELAAEELYIQFRERLAPRLDDFPTFASLTSPDAPDLLDPTFIAYEEPDTTAWRKRLTARIACAAGSADEIESVLDAALRVAAAAARERDDPDEGALTAWFRTGLDDRPAWLDYDGPGEDGMKAIADLIRRCMDPRGRCIWRMNGNRRAGMEFGSIEVIAEVEWQREETGHDVLRCAEIVTDWLTSRAQCSQERAQEIMKQLYEP